MRQGPLDKTGAEHLQECIPDIFNHKTVLYIGATVTRQLLVPEFKANGAVVDLLEVWPDNIKQLAEAAKLNPVFRLIRLGDVRSLRYIINPNVWWGQYDVICWWHGPEHVERYDLEAILDDMCLLANAVAICACPWGKFPQGAEGGNIYEKHLAELGPEDFVECGWEARGFGERDDPWSYVIGWKKSETLSGCRNGIYK